MDKTKIHPLILVAIGISAFAMGWRGYEDKDGASTLFILLCIFLAVLAIYGWMRNRKIDRYNRRIKKGQKLIR